MERGMKLRFNQPYLSITSFEEVELPNFTLITGLNGVGKTHLLEAIQKSHITIDRASRNFLLQSYENFRIKDSQPNDNYSFHTRWGTAQEKIAGVIKETREKLLSDLKTLDIPEAYKSSVEDALRLKEANPAAYNDTNVAPFCQHSLSRALAAIANCEKNIREIFPSDDASSYEHSRFQVLLEKHHPKSPLLLRKHDLVLPPTDNVQLFAQAINSSFSAYRDAYYHNSYEQSQFDKGLSEEKPPSDDEFLQRHGDKPWEIFNRTMVDLGLSFHINIPPDRARDEYIPRLISKVSGHEVSFANLSSGERTLMWLVLCLYNSGTGHHIVQKPGLLLLDEFDASLHPSMTRDYLRIIQDVIVGQLKIPVIATTHSASTVAQAPEDAIYIMKNDPHRLEKSSRGSALNLLTAGVPTLAVSYEGRRQVFCESDTDRIVYSEIYQGLRQKLNSERSLEFVNSGLSKKAGDQVSGGDINNGCAVTAKIVKTLETSGNTSVFGLIDWDSGRNIKHTKQSSRIFILAKGRRDALENLIFDPLMLAAFIVCSDKNDECRQSLDLSDKDIAYFMQLSSEKLQHVIDSVQQKILGAPPRKPADQVEVTYVGRQKLNVLKEYLELDDHQLGTKTLKALPSVAKAAKGAPCDSSKAHGLAMEAIAEKAKEHFIDFVPDEVFQVFKEILDYEAH
jgi:AAA15 family ATPase/GTPase